MDVCLRLTSTSPSPSAAAYPSVCVCVQSCLAQALSFDWHPLDLTKFDFVRTFYAHGRVEKKKKKTHLEAQEHFVLD